MKFLSIIILLFLIIQLSFGASFDPKKCSMCTDSVRLLGPLSSQEDREMALKFRFCKRYNNNKEECEKFIKEWVPKICDLLDSETIEGYHICPELKLCAPVPN